MSNDFLMAVRRLRGRPAFTLAATLTLALGIGANSAIFSVTNAAVLRWREAFHQPERLVMLWKHEAQYGNWHTTPADFRDWREQSTSFEHIGGFTYRTVTLSGPTEPRRIRAGRITPGFFAMLGVGPQLGRELAEDDMPWGRHRVTVVSDRFWRTHLGADPDVLGRPLVLDGETYSVVGVMPAGAWLAPQPAPLWIPLTYPNAEAANARNSRWHQAVGRLRPGITLPQVRAEMVTLGARIAAANPENTGWSIAVTTLEETALGGFRPVLRALGLAVFLVLLLACVNVAALVVARAERQAPELALRAALGAGRWRLMRQVLAEGLTLALLGGLAGLGLAHLAVKRLVHLIPADIPRLHEVGVAIDGRVLLFTVLVSGVTVAVFALVPAWRASQVSIGNDLISSSRGAVGGRHGRHYRAALVVVEVALAAMLLVGAGLLVRTVGHLGSLDVGVRSQELLTLDVELPAALGDELATGEAFFEDLVRRTEALPSVRSAGFTTELPLTDGGPGYYLGVVGRPEPASLGEVPIIRLVQTGGGAFEALGIPLRRGRVFADRDGAGSERVAVIDERIAKRFFGEQDPLGQRIRLGAPGFPWLASEIAAADGTTPPEYRVVGVVGNARYQLDDTLPGAVVYIPYRQQHWPTMGWFPDFLVAHTVGDPHMATAGIRAAIRSLDPGQPLGRARTPDDLAAEAFRGTHFALRLFSSFATLALALAVVGIYGVIAYSVARRRREIGVRMALGAERRDVTALVVRPVLWSTIVGLGLGLIGSLSLGAPLETLLRGVSRFDLPTLVAVGATLLIVAALAAYLPARRAAAIAPAQALGDQ